MKRILAILFLSALILVGCGDDSDQEPCGPAKMIPQKANIIAYVDLPTMINEMDIDGLIERVPKEPDDPQSLQDIYDMLGINE